MAGEPGVRWAQHDRVRSGGAVVVCRRLHMRRGNQGLLLIELIHGVSLFLIFILGKEMGVAVVVRRVCCWGPDVEALANAIIRGIGASVLQPRVRIDVRRWDWMDKEETQDHGEGGADRKGQQEFGGVAWKKRMRDGGEEECRQPEPRDHDAVSRCALHITCRQ